MGSDFGVKDAAGKVMRTAAEIQEEVPGKVPPQARTEKDLTKVVIIGGGACGMAAATKIRRQSDFKITVLSSDSHTAYSHCGIPFVLGREIESFEKLIVKPPGFFREKRNNFV